MLEVFLPNELVSGYDWIWVGLVLIGDYTMKTVMYCNVLALIRKFTLAWIVRNYVDKKVGLSIFNDVI